MRLTPAAAFYIAAACIAATAYSSAATGDDRSELMLKLLDEVKQVRQELQSLRNENEYLKHRIEQLSEEYRHLKQAPPKSPAIRDVRETDDAQTTQTKYQVPDLPVKSTLPVKEKTLKKIIPVPKSIITPKRASVGEAREYKGVIDLLNRGEFGKLQTALIEFLDKYENGKHAAEANYLLGEIYYSTEHYDEALENFTRIVRQFPNSKKKDAARLQISYIYYHRKDWKAARQLLETLLQSEDKQVTQLAQKRLDRMKRENH